MSRQLQGEPSATVLIQEAAGPRTECGREAQEME